jgi:hypothetical protein
MKEVPHACAPQRFTLAARLKSFGYAFEGIALMLKTQHNAGDGTGRLVPGGRRRLALADWRDDHGLDGRGHEHRGGVALRCCVATLFIGRQMRKGSCRRRRVNCGLCSSGNRCHNLLALFGCQVTVGCDAVRDVPPLWQGLSHR